MAISRPFLLALLGAVLLGATALAVQNSRTASDGSTRAGRGAVRAGAGARQTLDRLGPDGHAVSRPSSSSDLESARFSAKRDLRSRSPARRLRPRRRLRARRRQRHPRVRRPRPRISAAGQTLSGGFVSLGDKAYFVRGRHRLARARDGLGPARRDAAKGGSSQALPLDVHPEHLGARRQVRGHRARRRREDRPRLRRASTPRRSCKDLAKAAGNVAGLPEREPGRPRGQARRARRVGRLRRPPPAPPARRASRSPARDPRRSTCA